MKNSLKAVVWSVLVGIFRFVPASFLQLLCRLFFDSISKNKKSAEGLKRLFQLDDSLRWFTDQIAILYGNGTHPKHRLMEYHKFFIQRISSSDRVLDVGCGIGAVAASVAQSGATVVGVDMDAKNIDQAHKLYHHENIDFVHGDILTDPPNGPFDVIILSNVLEHIEGRIEILKELVRLYHPGKILVRVPMINRHWSVLLRKELGILYFMDPTHYIEYSEESFQQEINGAGLVLAYSQVIWGEIWAEVFCDG